MGSIASFVDGFDYASVRDANRYEVEKNITLAVFIDSSGYKVKVEVHEDETDLLPDIAAERSAPSTGDIRKDLGGAMLLAWQDYSKTKNDLKTSRTTN